MKEHKLLESETICDDDYPVYLDYCYIADNEVIRSNIQGTVRDLKRDLNAKEIRRCDIFGHRDCKNGDLSFGDIIK